jgi:hypothetical protein
MRGIVYTTVSNILPFSIGNDETRCRQDVEISSSGASGDRFAIAPDAAL